MKKSLVIILVALLLSSSGFGERVALTTFLYNTFEFNDALDKNVERVWKACKVQLEKKGYSIVPYDEIIETFKTLKIGEYKLSTREVHRLARELGVDKVITGKINKYLGYKGFSLSNFFLTEGQIKLEARMYSSVKQSWNWENNAETRKKYKLSGIFKKKGLVLRNVLKDVVRKLFKTFKKQDTIRLKKQFSN